MINYNNTNYVPTTKDDFYQLMIEICVDKDFSKKIDTKRCDIFCLEKQITNDYFTRNIPTSCIYELKKIETSPIMSLLSSSKTIDDEVLVNGTSEQILSAYDQFLANDYDKEIIGKKYTIAFNLMSAAKCALLFFKKPNADVTILIVYGIFQNTRYTDTFDKYTYYYLKNKILQTYRNFCKIADKKGLIVDITYNYDIDTSYNNKDYFAEITIISKQ